MATAGNWIAKAGACETFRTSPAVATMGSELPTPGPTLLPSTRSSTTRPTTANYPARSDFRDLTRSLTHKVARYDDRKCARLQLDAGIVRNRLKIGAAVTNARAVIEVQKEYGSLDLFVWSFVGGKPRINRPRSLSDIPARTTESDALSKALLGHGFRFVGSTIIYAFMQACGLVDDHVRGCFRAKRARRSG